MLAKLQNFVKMSLDIIASDHDRGPFTTAQKLSFLVGFCGVKPQDSAGRSLQAWRNQTFTLIYTDPSTSRSNFQTTCVPTYAEDSPFTLRLLDENTAEIVYEPGFDTFCGIDLNTGFLVRRHSVITKASNHYYSRVDPSLREVPTALIASPNSDCAGGCKMCSRSAAKTFEKTNNAYITTHVQEVAADYHRRAWKTGELSSVNITTGCQPSADHEFIMVRDIITGYHEGGFVNSRFHVFSYHITTEPHMKALLHNGAIGYIGTIETFEDVKRVQFWGPDKGSQSFDSHIKRYKLAHDVGYPIVETNYVIGTDSYDRMMSGIDSFDVQRVAVVPNIMRNYNIRQLQSISNDLWDIGFKYVLDGFTAAVSTYHHPTIKRYAGQKTVDYLNNNGWCITFADLPVRHT